MPTAEDFDAYPAFPAGLRVYDLPKLSYEKLLSGDPRESSRLFQASKDLGFFQLDLRGIAEGESFIRDATSVLRLNVQFSGLNVSEKSEYTTKPPEVIFGWKPPGGTKLEDGREDRCEFYSISQDSVLGTGVAQKNPPIINESTTLLKSFMSEAHSISTLLLHHLNEQLNLPCGHLASLHSTSNPSMTTVRLIHMPPQPPHDRRTSLFGHTDNGSITILFNIISGLQILPPGSPNEECNWRWVRPEPGCATVNLGDALVQLSGGILRSNFHRVVSPAGEQAEWDRYSFAYVLKPDNEASMQKLVESTPESAAFEDNHYSYRDWLAVKAEGSRTGKNIIRIGSVAKLPSVEGQEDPVPHRAGITW